MQGLWVLIFVIGHGSYTGDDLRMQEFTTLENCKVAGKVAVEMFYKNAAAHGFFECVNK